MTATAVTTTRGFREYFRDRAQRLPAVADILDATHGACRRDEVIAEGDLRTGFDQGLASKRGLYLLLAAAPDHDAHEPRTPRPCSRCLRQASPRIHEGLHDQAIAWGLNLVPINAQSNHFSHCVVARR